MTTTRTTGSYDDALLDDLSLRVSAPAPAPAPGGTDPLAPAPAPVASPAPAMGSTATVSAAGVAGVPLTCPVAATRTCRGTLVLDAAAPAAAAGASSNQVVRIARGGRRINFGKRAFTIAPGSRATVGVRLTRAARARLAGRSRLAARARTIVPQADGTRLVTARRLFLVAPRP